MTTPERTLYQFPISHYCEKTRWNLDAKGLTYEVRNLFPGAHRISTKRLSGVRTVPVLVDRGTPVGDSTAIALHLEDAYPDPPLLPKDATQRSRALEIEDYFDRYTGKAVRQWIYGELMAKPGGAAQAFFETYSLPVQLIGKVVGPLFEAALRRTYKINDEGIASARKYILAAADRIEAETGGDPSRYLAGDSLSIADIAAASLMSPVVGPHESPYARPPGSMPAAIEEMRRAMLDRPAGKWIMARYERDRRRGST